MFKVGDEFTVKFDKRWHSDAASRKAKKGNGRYDTACKIEVHASHGDYAHYGIARLHPNDQLNRVTGKKLALEKAILPALLKTDKTLIWDAFWEYIQSWGVKDTGRSNK